MAHVDHTGAFIDLNERMCEIAGRPREQLLRLRFQDITHPDDLSSNVAVLDQLVRGERSIQTFEKRYVLPNGRLRWVQISTASALDDQGRFQHTVAVVLDIEQRRLAEQVLREREAQFSKLASSRARRAAAVPCRHPRRRPRALCERGHARAV